MSEFSSTGENVATSSRWCVAENSGNKTTQTFFCVLLGGNAQKHNKRNHDLTDESEQGKKKKKIFLPDAICSTDHNTWRLILFQNQGSVETGQFIRTGWNC